jgi:hypothetical protein
LAPRIICEPAPTDFIQYFTMNFIQHFIMPVGAGSPIALKRVNKLNKLAPPRNSYFAYLFVKLEIALCQKTLDLCTGYSLANYG